VSRSVGIGLLLAAVSAVTAFPASAIAAAATPQQCAALKELLTATVANERTAQDQSLALSRQPMRLSAALVSLQLKYRQIDKADFKDIESVGSQLEESAAALTKDFDATINTLNSSLTVVQQLCN